PIDYTGRKSSHVAQFSIICRANASFIPLCDCQCPASNVISPFLLAGSRRRAICLGRCLRLLGRFRLVLFGLALGYLALAFCCFLLLGFVFVDIRGTLRCTSLPFLFQLLQTFFMIRHLLRVGICLFLAFGVCHLG